MATLNGNGAYLDLDGTSLGAYFKEVSFEGSVETEDITAGSGATHVERASKLQDVKGKITIVWDDAMASTHLPLLKAGAHTLTWGPEGNTAGKPKHVVAIIIENLSHGVAVEKNLVLHEADFVGAAAPTTDMFAGGVWS